MKRVGALLLLLLLPGLLGCTGGSDDPLERAMDFRARLLGAEGCSFLGQVTADYGQEVHSFTLSCDVSSQGVVSFTVTAPQSISGITGSITGTEGRLQFSDTVLPFSPLAEGELSPVAAPWVIWQSWYTGYISICGQETGAVRMTVESVFREKPLVVETWLGDEFGLPLSAEICYNGHKLLSMTLSDFQFTSE